MYPEGTLINLTKDNLVIFEKDLSNPENQGFVDYWDIIKPCQLILTFWTSSSSKNK